MVLVEHIEFIITLRCKICGDMVSLQVGLVYPESSKQVKDFSDHHEHNDNTDPWVI